jgi:hypothetical protein
MAVRCHSDPAERHREHALLLCCARTSLDPRQAAYRDDLLRQGLDWGYVVRAADRHQVLALLHVHLRGRPELPRSAASELEARFRRSAAHNVRCGQELCTLIELFRAHGLRAIPYKGPILAQKLYGDRFLRQFTDLDVLMGVWDYGRRAETLLTAHGWRKACDWGHEKTFVSERTGVCLDLHRGVTHRAMPLALDFNEIWGNAEEVAFEGQAARTFSVPDLLLVLCAQLAKDAATNSLTLIKVSDVAELVRIAEPNVHWDALMRRASRLDAFPLLAVGLRAAADLLDAPLPDEVRQRIRAISSADRLATHVRECILGPVGGVFSYPELLDQFRFEVELLGRLRRRDRRIGDAVSRVFKRDGRVFPVLWRALLLVHYAGIARSLRTRLFRS